jgi:hypothetical protein
MRSEHQFEWFFVYLTSSGTEKKKKIHLRSLERKEARLGSLNDLD